MKKIKVLSIVTIFLVLILGSIPGFEICLSDISLLFQSPDNQYWRIIVTGISSLLVGILIGFYLSRYLLGIWLRNEKAIGINSFLILLITIIAGIIALMVSWEVTWVLPRIFGWKYTGEFSPWANLLDHYLLMLIYAIIPVGIAGVINGLFSYIYLRFSK